MNDTKRLRGRIFLILLAQSVLILVLGVGAYVLMSNGDSTVDSPQSVENVSGHRPADIVFKTATPAAGTPTPAPTPVPPFANQSFRITIDRIGVDAPVVSEGLDDEQIPIVPLNGTDVAWYTFSAQPGSPGNAVFAGHKTWAGDAVFHELDQLKVGDVVRLHGDSDNVELIYEITDSFTVSADDPNAVQVMHPTPASAGEVMTIITCDGTRYYTGDPVYGHDYTERRVIRAVRTGYFQQSG